MHTAYNQLAKYYDLLYQDKDYPKEARFIRQIVRRRCPNAKSLLDVGCGTGTHLRLLQDDFKTLAGVDLSPQIVTEAKKKVPQAQFAVGDMKTFRLNQRFDVLTCLYSVFNYNLTPKEARQTLKNFASHLQPKGLLILALYTPHNTEKKLSLHLGRDERTQVAKLNQFTYDPKTQLETSEFMVLIKEGEKLDFFTETNHQLRVYGVKELTSLLREEGFTSIKAYDNFEEKEIGPNTKYPVVVSQIKENEPPTPVGCKTQQ